MITFPKAWFRSCVEGLKAPEGWEWTLPMSEKSIGNMWAGKLANLMPMVANGGIIRSVISILPFFCFPRNSNIISLGYCFSSTLKDRLQQSLTYCDHSNHADSTIWNSFSTFIFTYKIFTSWLKMFPFVSVGFDARAHFTTHSSLYTRFQSHTYLSSLSDSTFLTPIQPLSDNVSKSGIQVTRLLVVSRRSPRRWSFISRARARDSWRKSERKPSESE